MDTLQSSKTCAPFQLKAGMYPLTAIQILDPALSDFDAALHSKIQQAPRFFCNAPFVIDLQKIKAQQNCPDFVRLAKSLKSQKMIAVGVKGGNAEQNAAAQKAGFAVLPDQRVYDPEEKKPTPKQIKTPAPDSASSSDATQPMSPSRLITSPVRSGQQVYAPMGDLIVLASVSNGAELLADGHIHVYGTMRGRALAGIHGNKEARIFCHMLEAELLSIAGQYRLHEDMSQLPAWKQHVVVSLIDEQLSIESLD